jgi:hypothetical protein
MKYKILAWISSLLLELLPTALLPYIIVTFKLQTVQPEHEWWYYTMIIHIRFLGLLLIALMIIGTVKLFEKGYNN